MVAFGVIAGVGADSRAGESPDATLVAILVNRGGLAKCTGAGSRAGASLDATFQTALDASETLALA